MTGLPVKRVADVDASPPEKWLVETLWTHQAVGIVAGHPKSNKSWLALDFAVSVASGTPALDRFPVNDPGPVLLFPAEDALTAVRDRMAGMCRHRKIDFDALDVWLIDSHVLRLDSSDDCQALDRTVADLRPRLLVLDPLIRLHAADENSASEIARVLSFLRDLQRKHATAVLLVHHVRKCASNDPGLGLRGSTEIRAWSDTNLYMRRGRHLELVVEHRAAPCPDPMKLTLVTQDEQTVHLTLDTEPAPTMGLRDRILALLEQTDAPVSRDHIRNEVGARNQTVGQALQALVDEHIIEKAYDGYRLVKEAVSDL